MRKRIFSEQEYPEIGDNDETCDKHNEVFSTYCKECKKAFCDLCPSHDSIHPTVSLLCLPMPEDIDARRKKMEEIKSRTKEASKTIIFLILITQTASEYNKLAKNKKKYSEANDVLEDLNALYSKADNEIMLMEDLIKLVKINYEENFIQASLSVKEFYGPNVESLEKEVELSIKTVGMIEDCALLNFNQFKDASELKSCAQLVFTVIENEDKENPKDLFQKAIKEMNEERVSCAYDNLMDFDKTLKSNTEETKQNLKGKFLIDFLATRKNIVSMIIKSMREHGNCTDFTSYLKGLKERMISTIEGKNKKLIEQSKKSLIYRNESDLSLLNVRDKEILLETSIEYIDSIKRQQKQIEKFVMEYEEEMKKVYENIKKLSDGSNDIAKAISICKDILEFYTTFNYTEEKKVIKERVINLGQQINSVIEIISNTKENINTEFNKAKEVTETSSYNTKTLYQLMNNAIIQANKTKSYLQNFVERNQPICEDGRAGKIRLKCGHYICSGCVINKKIKTNIYYCMSCGGSKQTAGKY